MIHDNITWKNKLKYSHPRLLAFYRAVKYCATTKGYCPFCQKQVPLVSGGRPFPRKHAKCVFCESLERHRFLYYVYSTHILSCKKNIRMLHFAPEEMFTSLFLSRANIEYRCADIYPEDYKFAPCLKMNALKTGLPDKSLDVIIANHLIEHVNEEQFFLEMRRILADDGKLLISAPVYMDMAVTQENPAYDTPALRKQFYGHPEHLRKYGADAAKRFEKYFDVSFIPYNALPPFGDLVNSNCFILQKY